MDTTDKVLVSLRRILRSIDQHSKNLVQQQGLTVPQLIVLRAIETMGTPSISELAKTVSLSNATMSAILDRMVKRGYVDRVRSTVDKRKVQVEITAVGQSLLARSPSPLHERFMKRFGELKDWEQNQILASLQRVADLMDSRDLDVAPMLAVEPMSPDEPADMIQRETETNASDNRPVL